MIAPLQRLALRFWVRLPEPMVRTPEGRAVTADPGQATRPLWKRAADAKARAAMKGITLHELTGDDGQPEFIASRHAMTKAFAGAGAVAAAETWLDRIEGKQP